MFRCVCAQKPYEQRTSWYSFLVTTGTSMLWVDGHNSSSFLPVKISMATKWTLAWPCFPVFEVDISTILQGRLLITTKPFFLKAEHCIGKVVEAPASPAASKVCSCYDYDTLVYANRTYNIQKQILYGLSPALLDVTIHRWPKAIIQKVMSSPLLPYDWTTPKFMRRCSRQITTMRPSPVRFLVGLCGVTSWLKNENR